MGQGARAEGQGAVRGAGFRQLKAWQAADELAFTLISLVERLPSQKRWMASQVSRAAISVPANIAEGYSRASLREYLRHLSIARGSLGETEYYIHLLSRLDLLTPERGTQLAKLVRETGGLLYGLIRSLSKKLEMEPGTRSYSIGEDREVTYREDSHDP